MKLNDVILDWFCLINTKGVGSKTFWALMRAHKTATNALRALESPFPKIEAEKLLKRMNCEIILANDEYFPKSLRRTGFCPPLLFFKGDKSILQKRKISIIGARNASINGKNMAKNLAINLSADFAIASGLARGIDTSAHIGSLSGEKAAIAILPFGFDNIYPKENQKLFEEITEKGIVISEVPYGRPVDHGMFQARNRIISLISEGIIVIEAAYKSGTMATASLALDFGCEVMVVPGSPTDPRNLGSNSLIKNGASLIQDHFDVLEILGHSDGAPQTSVQPENNSPSKQENSNDKESVLSLLSTNPVALDELSTHLKIDFNDLLSLISELEISGDVIRNSNNEIILNRKA